jgi:hypothetical protein
LAPKHAPLRVLLAHAQVAGGRHREALSSLDAKGIDTTTTAVALLKAAAHRGLEHPARAYEVLTRSVKAHPDHPALVRELVILCASQGLFETARSWAERLPPAELSPRTAVAALESARDQTGGVGFARFLGAGFPDDAQVQAQLGWTLSAAGLYADAARSLDRAAMLGADTAFPAAEHYRAARRYRDALSLNARVPDPERRAGQRFDLLFESGKMARAIEAGKSLEAKGTLTPRRRYSLAYAHYSLRQFAEATRHARALTDTAESERARTLLRAMGR